MVGKTKTSQRDVFVTRLSPREESLGTPLRE